MTKRHFIQLADLIIKANTDRIRTDQTDTYSAAQIAELADFCQSQNSQFDRARWLGYIAGTNGKNGGKK